VNCANVFHATEMQMAVLFVGAARKVNGETEPIADTHVAPHVPPARLSAEKSAA